MEIRRVDPEGKTDWNKFVRQHYPPVGAFMQTWEWGVFQEHLGRKVERYRMDDTKHTVAVFTLVHHRLPMLFSYGYIPRGPVIATHAMGEADTLEIFKSLRTWITEENLPGIIFLRMEPPLTSLTPALVKLDFRIPPYYIQPRFNHAIVLDRSEEEILRGFHPSTRSNMRKAENRGVTVEFKHSMTEADCDSFFSMAAETIERNSGINAYPDRPYFYSLLKAVPSVTGIHDLQDLSLGQFYGCEYGKPAAIHVVLFFGNTATYLYGASYSRALRSKVTTYLHWAAMREAKKRGLKYYDLGGVDDARWPTLTNFKRQFRGTEFSYIGNIDIPVKPILYRVYNLARKLKGVSSGA